MGLYLVARVIGGVPTDAQIIETRDTGSTIIPEAAANAYDGKKPGMRLSVWTLGLHPSTYIAGEDGETVHEGARGLRD